MKSCRQDCPELSEKNPGPSNSGSAERCCRAARPRCARPRVGSSSLRSATWEAGAQEAQDGRHRFGGSFNHVAAQNPTK